MAASEAMLVAKPLEHPPRRAPLLSMDLAITFQPAIDDLGEPIQLRPLYRRRPPVSGRNRERQHLPNAVARNPKLTRSLALAHAF